MDKLENVEFGALIYNGILRDGGSAVIILSMSTYKVKIRVMRSISEQRGAFSNFIEISVDDKVIGNLKSKNDIDGLNEFLLRNQDKLDQRVLVAFAFPVN